MYTPRYCALTLIGAFPFQLQMSTSGPQGLSLFPSPSNRTTTPKTLKCPTLQLTCPTWPTNSPTCKTLAINNRPTGRGQGTRDSSVMKGTWRIGIVRRGQGRNTPWWRATGKGCQGDRGESDVVAQTVRKTRKSKGCLTSLPEFYFNSSNTGMQFFLKNCTSIR